MQPKINYELLPLFGTTDWEIFYVKATFAYSLSFFLFFSPSETGTYFLLTLLHSAIFFIFMFLTFFSRFFIFHSTLWLLAHPTQASFLHLSKRATKMTFFLFTGLLFILTIFFLQSLPLLTIFSFLSFFLPSLQEALHLHFAPQHARSADISLFSLLLHLRISQDVCSISTPSFGF